MKNKSNFLLLSAFVGGLLFSFLFWEERLAINLCIYSIFLLTITWLNPDVTKTTKFKFYGMAHLLAAILVVINNSDLTLVSYYISLMLFIGFSHNQQLRTVFTSLLSTVLQMLTIPFNAIRNLSEVTVGNFNLKPVFRLIKYVFIPVLIIIVFSSLYAAANSVFAHYTEQVLVSIGDVFDAIFGFIFKDLSFPRFIHFCFGLIVTGGLIITFSDKALQNFELKFKEQLFRIRNNSNQKTIWFELAKTFSGNLLIRKLALKTEFITALLSFTALNLLLLLLNIIDITTLWFGQKPSGNFSAELHDGTNTLIFSIILAMAIIIYFFRANLNFYSKSKVLRMLAFAWMFQNALLIISVLIRDGYYIEFHGLTHKRIGVLVFALLCAIGLSTVYLKVVRQKTFFYLLKINGNTWFALLLAFSVINWDVFIVKYNLSHADSISIDTTYLLSLSDKTLPFIDKNKDKLLATPVFIPKGEVIIDPTNDQLINRLDQRINFFKERYEKSGWLSWNLQDWNTAEYFNLNKK
ncbi:DUF4173 domain-containing protein [Pedobacter aquatilis]|uniref:DUF4153 domain-containing protein n=1 Tax=Pedobacter aquatilis TaxID=351343 RepID=UPI002931413A|nr:DUF4173 domain-containing protein [Pedobacter aquatilis]